MATSEIVAGQAAIDQNVMELKNLLKLEMARRRDLVQSFGDFLYEANDNLKAAAAVNSLPSDVREAFLQLLIPCGCVGWQTVVLSIEAEKQEQT